MDVDIYSDGSGNTQTKNGGWAYRILIDGKLVAEDSGHIKDATNNSAELRGAIEGLKKALEICKNLSDKKTYSLISDSKLVLGYADGTYSCKAQHLITLYLELKELSSKLNLQTTWVKSHSGDLNNEACDKLAKSARKNVPAG